MDLLYSRARISGFWAVKRSGIFMTVLLSLFMFQSLWNVAAAFCDHENTGVTVSQSFSSHFGHHVAPNCSQDLQQHQKTSILNDATSNHQHHVQLNDFLNHLERLFQLTRSAIFSFAFAVRDKALNEKEDGRIYLQNSILRKDYK